MTWGEYINRKSIDSTLWFGLMRVRWTEEAISAMEDEYPNLATDVDSGTCCMCFEGMLGRAMLMDEDSTEYVWCVRAGRRRF